MSSNGTHSAAMTLFTSNLSINQILNNTTPTQKLSDKMLPIYQKKKKHLKGWHAFTAGNWAKETELENEKEEEEEEKAY
jgi:predicted oxidoreductase